MTVRLTAVLCGVCAVFFFSASGARAGGAEVPVYEIEARLDTSKHSLSAVETITFSNTSPRPANEIFFNIYPHRKYSPSEIKFMYMYGGYFKVNPYPEGFQGGDLRIVSVSEGGRERKFDYSKGDCARVGIRLDRDLAPGEQATLRIAFEVDIPHSYGRFGWHNGIIALNRWYPMLVVSDDRGCHTYPFYLYHHPYFSDAAQYRLALTVPADQVVACTGALKERKYNADGTQTMRFETAAPERDFSLGVSARFKVWTLKHGGLTVNSYYLEGDQLRAKQAARDAGQLIVHHSALFFPYPYPEFSIVPCYLGYGGENSSSLIFIDTRVYRLPGILDRYFDFLISHETGHQWFYNAVGSDEYREMFLDEGVNSYWTIRYLEDKYGYNAQVMELPWFLKPFIPNFSFRDSAAIRYLYMARNGLDRPVIGELSSFQEPSSIFALAYGKGQATLDMLERMVGRVKFDAAMKRYAGEYRFRNASLDDLIAVFNRETGKDLGWFFDEWLRTKKTCDYAVKKVEPGKVTVENRSSIEMPVKTRVTFTDGTSTEDAWDGAGRERTIPVDKRIREVAVDPQEDIVLDIDRVNNNWPARHDFKLVPLSYFAYNLPMLQDRGAYNYVAGPTVGTQSGAALTVQKPFTWIGKFSSQYDFNDRAFDNRVGAEINPAFGKQSALGFELFDHDAHRPGFEVSGGRLYYRKELWPANYGLLDINDHITAYLLHDTIMSSTNLWSGTEDIRNQVYTRRRETVIGFAGSLQRRGPYPDPVFGWRIVPVQEFGGRFLDGDEDFWRSSLELDNYFLVWPKHDHKIATRIKGGTGGPADLQLFQMGGQDDLRGYSSKSIQGSRILYGSVEYRFPLARTLALKTPGNFVNLDTVQLVAFYDAGKAWNGDFSSRHYARDTGLGLRFVFDTIGFLEKTVLRFDAAKPLDGPDRDIRCWLAINQTF